MLTGGGVDIGFCANPKVFVIVDMENDDAIARKTGIPPILLAVLYDVILVGEAIVADEVSLWLVTQSRHVSNGCRRE